MVWFCSASVVRVVDTQGTETTATRSAVNGPARSAPVHRLKLAGVRNAGQISDVLYRGAQPSANGFAELKNLGVTTIVNLREKGRETEWERNVASSLGMGYVNIPIRGWTPPTDEQVAEFLRLFRDAPSQRVFVHCHYGEDRTGVMVAVYRIAMQNWTADQAAKEMYSFGFHYHLYPAMKAYVRKFPANFANEAVFSSIRTVSSQTSQP